MNYIKINKFDIANGPGVRVVLWVSGCHHNCRNCHNPETHDFKAGQLFDSEVMNSLIKSVNGPYISGLTISGGDPLSSENKETVLNIIRTINLNCPSKSVWIYTGYTLTISDLQSMFTTLNVDVVVDGPYIESERDISLPFCGSRNQRLIDVKSSLQQNMIVIYHAS